MRRMDNSCQCCIKDGSRPTAYVVQTKYANHLKVLCLKGMVLNVQAKGVCKDIRYVDCSSYLFTGYRTTGIKAAGALHRLLYET